MRLASLMMYISPPLIFILYVCVGRSDAAPHDASPLSGQPGAASLTWGSSLTDVPGPGPESRLAPGSLISLTPSPVIVSGGPTAAPPAAAFQPPPADPTTGLTPAAAKAQIPAPLPRSPGKRSTDARPSLLAPEKRLQTLGSAGSVVAQRTDNDAWAAADGTAGPAAASVESQGESRNHRNHRNHHRPARSRRCSELPVDELRGVFYGFDAETHRVQQWAPGCPSDPSPSMHGPAEHLVILGQGPYATGGVVVECIRPVGVFLCSARRRLMLTGRPTSRFLLYC